MPEPSKKTRVQAAKELHARKAKEREDKAVQTKAEYQKIKDEPALVDILEKAKSFAAYHAKLAEDGVGARRVGVDENNQDVLEEYYLDSHQVARELGGSSALRQLIIYIENKIA